MPQVTNSRNAHGGNRAAQRTRKSAKSQLPKQTRPRSKSLPDFVAKRLVHTSAR
ncbi:hypothetical protein KCP73_11005 [Salmonella enterica subsp. enterica]|nr:hypothetical protein KCP73_11005 [Salmonella enterica subsp. enterica]